MVWNFLDRKEETRFDSDEITDGMQAWKPNTLEQLIENAKLHVWAVNSRGPVYNGAAKSTLRNKRAYWRKVASGSKKITEMFPTNEAAKPNTDNDPHLMIHVRAVMTMITNSH